MQIVHLNQGNSSGVAYTAQDRGVVPRLQSCNDHCSLAAVGAPCLLRLLRASAYSLTDQAPPRRQSRTKRSVDQNIVVEITDRCLTSHAGCRAGNPDVHPG